MKNAMQLKAIVKNWILSVSHTERMTSLCRDLMRIPLVKRMA